MLVYIIDYGYSCVAMDTHLENIKSVFVDNFNPYSIQKLRVIRIKKSINRYTCEIKKYMKDYV